MHDSTGPAPAARAGSAPSRDRRPAPVPTLEREANDVALRLGLGLSAAPSPGALAAEASLHLGAPAPRPAGEGDGGVRRAAGDALGYDFSAVRFHVGDGASAMARHERAHAVTTGRDVHFAPGRFRPDLPLGRALIAHELAHVAQLGAAAPLEGREPALSAAPPGARLRLESCGCGSGCGTGPAPGAPEETTQPEGAQEGPTVEEAPPGAEGETEGAPARAPAAAVRTAGADPPRDPYRVVRIAWTMDDGPTPSTGPMEGVMGGRPATWYVMRNMLGTGAARDAALADLRARQARGDEIAIHAMHPTIAHAAWYPVQVATHVPKAYDTVADAMRDLTDFAALLRGAGLTVEFARMPGGELTELLRYMESLGATGSLEALAGRIHRGESMSGESAPVQTAAAAFAEIQTTLNTLGLKLWSGSASGAMFTRTTWEAEVAPAGSGLTNDALDRFRGVVDQFETVHRPRSFVILTHDTSAAFVTQVEQTRTAMEEYATTNGVRIEYYTMSGLYTELRGTPP